MCVSGGLYLSWLSCVNHFVKLLLGFLNHVGERTRLLHHGLDVLAAPQIQRYGAKPPHRVESRSRLHITRHSLGTIPPTRPALKSCRVKSGYS